MSEIRPAKFVDALDLAGRLRFEDAREIAVSWGLGVREGLFQCLLQSDRAFTLFENDRAEALWGVTAASHAGLRLGIPWMLAGEHLFDRRRALLGKSRRIVHHLLLDYDVLTNSTDAANDAHLRWLAWCGFRLLRRYENHGVEQPAFLDFYQISPRCQFAPEAVEAILRRRHAPRRPAPQNGSHDGEIVAGLVRAAMELLDGTGKVSRSSLDQLTPALLKLADPTVVDTRTRRGCAALLLEIAARVNGRQPERGGGSLLGHRPLGELLAALADVADVLTLEETPRGPDLVLALEPARVPSGPQPQAGKSPGAVRAVRQGGVAAFQWLMRRYVRMLTVDGRVGRVQGARLWAAAVGAGEASARPLGISRESLCQLLRDHVLSQSLVRGDPLCMSVLAGQRRALLALPRGHGEAMAGIRDLCNAGRHLDRVVIAQLDDWALEVQPGSLDGKIRSVGGAVAVVSAIADRVALRVLPSLRLGGIVSGYADRHWLYRLLRARLLLAASGRAPGELLPMLVDEVAGLLLAARLEHRLLLESAETPATEEVEVLLRDACAFWGPGAVIDDGGGHLLGLLTPVLAVPAVHRLQLAPALLVWHLMAVGGLEEGWRRLSDVVGQDGFGSRLAYRNVLRSLGAGVDIVTFGRHLGLAVDAEEPDRVTPFSAARSR